MPQLVCELIVTLDTFARGGPQSLPYFGYGGPEFDSWINTTSDEPHRNLVGRTSYEMLSDLPEDVRDEGWRKMVATPGILFSRTLETSEWPGLMVSDDLLGKVRELKADGGDELRTVGSLSLVRQLLEAGLVDRLRSIVCPLILPKSGNEPAFEGLPDMAFDLLSSKILDGRVLVLDYHPAGAPPTA